MSEETPALWGYDADLVVSSVSTALQWKEQIGRTRTPEHIQRTPAGLEYVFSDTGYGILIHADPEENTSTWKLTIWMLTGDTRRPDGLVLPLYVHAASASPDAYRTVQQEDAQEYVSIDLRYDEPDIGSASFIQTLRRIAMEALAKKETRLLSEKLPFLTFTKVNYPSLYDTSNFRLEGTWQNASFAFIIRGDGYRFSHLTVEEQDVTIKEDDHGGVLGGNIYTRTDSIVTTLAREMFPHQEIRQALQIPEYERLFATGPDVPVRRINGRMIRNEWELYVFLVFLIHTLEEKNPFQHPAEAPFSLPSDIHLPAGRPLPDIVQW